MNCSEKESEKGQEKTGGITKSSEQTSKKGPDKDDSELAKSNEKKSKNELGKTGSIAAKNNERKSKKELGKTDRKAAKNNERKSKKELGKTSRKAAKNNDNSKHCKNLYVGSVGVSLQRVACSLPILLCWFEILALQNLQAFSKHEVTNVNVCTKHKSFFVVHENLFILHL